MSETDSERWQVDDLTIDVGSLTVLRDGATIPLPHLSFAFLLALVRAAPNVVSVDALMEQVWKGIFVNNETVTQRAKLLRDALQDDHRSPRYLTVRRGSGYQLLPIPVRLDVGALPAQPPARQRHRSLAAIAFGLLALTGVAAVQFRPDRQETSAEHSPRIAVLPFDNLSSDPSDAYIARGISEMVLSRLAATRGLTVIARDSALIGAASRLSPQDAGKELQTDYLIRGSVQRNGGTLRVISFVVDTRSGTRRWSENFDWPVNRVYALQDRIADRIAASFRTQNDSDGVDASASAMTHNADAYLAYLKGKSLLGRFTIAETEAAAEQFERAVRYDPSFAPALVALFDSRMQAADLRRDDLEAIRARYQPLLDRALQLAPNSGEALFAKAMWSNLPREGKAELFRHAAALEPNNSRGLIAYAQFLGGGSNGGAYDGIGDGTVTRDGENGTERKRLLDHVLAIDPLNPRARFIAIMQRLGELTPSQVEEEQRKALDLDPDNYPLANRYAARLWMFHGETAEAIARMERVIATDPQNPWGPHIITAFYLDANDPVAAWAAAQSTPTSRESSRTILAQYRGDWRAAGQAALGPRGFLFNRYQTWLWPETIRDYALQTKQYQLGAELIASRYGFDLRNPRTTSLPHTTAAPALGHLLLAAGNRAAGERLLAQTVQWIDDHPRYGLSGLARVRAEALMLLGQRSQALSDLKAAVDTAHDIRHWWYLVDRDPVWAAVHDDPRFREIVAHCRSAAQVQREKLDVLRRAGVVPQRPPLGRA